MAFHFSHCSFTPPTNPTRSPHNNCSYQRNCALSISLWSMASSSTTCRCNLAASYTFFPKYRTISPPKQIGEMRVQQTLNISPFSAYKKLTLRNLTSSASLNALSLISLMCCQAPLSPSCPYSTIFLARNFSLSCRHKNCFRLIRSLQISYRSGSSPLRIVLSLRTTGAGSEACLLRCLPLALLTVCPGCFSFTWQQRAGYERQALRRPQGQNSQARVVFPSCLAYLRVVRLRLQSLLMALPFPKLDSFYESLISYYRDGVESQKSHPYLQKSKAYQNHSLIAYPDDKFKSRQIIQQISLIMTEQKSSKETFPSRLLSAFSTINLNVSSSRFSLTWLLTSLKSSMVRQFLLSLSYFLKMAAISFFVSFLQGFVSIAFINSMKEMPPASSTSNSATTSQVVFRLGLKPFCVNSNFRSLGSSTPMPVESQASKTSFRSSTSWQLRLPVMQSSGQNSRRSLRLKRTPYSLVLSILDSDLSGEQPNFCEEFLSSLLRGALKEEVWFLGTRSDISGESEIINKMGAQGKGQRKGKGRGKQGKQFQ